MTRGEETSLARATLALRVCVALEATGYLWLALTRGTPFGKAIFLGTPLLDLSARAVDHGVAGAAFALALTLLWRPTARTAWVLFGWSTLLALGSAGQYGSYYAWIGPLAWAARWFAPACLALALSGEGRHASTLSRLAIGATFAAHGLEAVWLHPKFVDLILASAYNAFGFFPRQSSAESALLVIGAVDLVVAALAVLGARWRPLWAWATLWGLITALSRVTQFGIMGGGSFALTRAPHALLPLFVLMHYARVPDKLSNSQSTEDAEEEE